ncbi:helix-hairpin-helix domain-containing protein [Flammeovirga sp. MY04]|uniref:ComEA family DNA-binding protein n=1 Tax=Flammeovirga sp. MY04 TaxID=1191459 RepID=UPI0008063660|nr:helix-hairpin-helix domain-containing protein [Flammeovirga sp. MY04]ANQ51059.1 helix-hairpin-helix domain-containing protein [Flammeovirga sp. MY04]
MKTNFQSLFDWFGLNYRSIESIIYLVPTLVLFLFADVIYQKIFPSPAVIVFEASSNNLKESKEIPLFDPNIFTVEEWKDVGLESHVAKSIVKYRLKGGRFNSVEDLKKIYLLTDDVYDQISPYVKIDPPKLEKRKWVKKEKYTRYSKEKKTTTAFNPKRFDPNKVSKQELLEMGFSHQLSNSMVAYRTSGGSFKSKDDVLKLYGVDSAQFMEWKKYINLPEQEQLLVKEVPKVISKFNLNKATHNELTQLKGIGDYSANQIIKYRNRLGGSFYSLHQLEEVFGIDSLKVKILNEFCYINPEDIKKININTSTYEQLATHPYLNYKQARWIVMYRKQHGDYADLSDVLRIKTLQKQDLLLMIPYLQYN